MCDFARARGPARVQGIANRDGRLASPALERLGQTELGDEPANLTVPQMKRRERRPAEPGRASRIVDVARFRSNAERLMTFKTSEVAVCCCSASVRSRVRACTSSKRRRFSIAITAWSANVRTSSIRRGENSPGSGRDRTNTPSTLSFRSRGTPSNDRVRLSALTGKSYSESARTSRMVSTLLDKATRAAMESRPATAGVPLESRSFPATCRKSLRSRRGRPFSGISRRSETRSIPPPTGSVSAGRS